VRSSMHAAVVQLPSSTAGQQQRSAGAAVACYRNVTAVQPAVMQPGIEQHLNKPLLLAQPQQCKRWQTHPQRAGGQLENKHSMLELVATGSEARWR
jgi:hypothetical protein